jgi:drug/metabolite transporter (DMT)-like permease
MSAQPASLLGDERRLFGIGLMVVAMSIVPLMDGVAKHLSADYTTLQVVWARYFFHLLILLPLVLWRYGRRALLPARPAVQLLRGGLLLASTILFFTAIASMPLADALALVFISPLIVTALSPLILGEHVGVRRWSAVLVGFLGALVIIRPGLGVFDPAALLAAGAGAVYATYLIATRKLAGSAPPLVTLAYTALLGAVVMTAVQPAVWIWPTPGDWAWMAGMGALAASGHFMIIKAFDHAPASVLAPFTYSEMAMATAVGFFAFGDFPDPLTWVGVAIIVASGLYISFRERKLGRRPAGVRPGT